MLLVRRPNLAPDRQGLQRFLGTVVAEGAGCGGMRAAGPLVVATAAGVIGNEHIAAMRLLIGAGLPAAAPVLPFLAHILPGTGLPSRLGGIAVRQIVVAVPVGTQ